MDQHDAAKDPSHVARSARVHAVVPLFVAALASIALASLRPDLATFPIAGVRLAIPIALVAPPDAGLPGTLRVFTYHADDREPWVSYPTLGPHGWRISMLVASGVRVAVP